MAGQGHVSGAALTLDPLSASVLAANETIRRDANLERGALRSGCPELDGYVLLGGLERGSVVGVSSEVEDFSVKLAIQVLAKGLFHGTINKALVITPRPRTELLRSLRDGLVAAGGEGAVNDDVKRHLEKVMLSCVFDVDGLWEVLADLDRTAAPGGDGAVRAKSQATPVPASIPDPVVPDVSEVPEASLEIKDSQDEGSEEELSPPPPPSPPKPRPAPAPSAAVSEVPISQEAPDIIIVTHISSLLTSLFTHRSSSAAHSTLQLLSSHLRHLSRTLSSNPLILLLNSTTTATSGPPNPSNQNAPGSGGTGGGGNRNNKPLDPTLSSIFNPPPLAGNYSFAAANTWTRRNKPTFGLVFAQMLDMHILCTKVPRSSADADEVFGLPQQLREQGQQERQGQLEKQQKGQRGPRYVTVVEVLLDEMGVWEEGRRRGPRRSREQRWAAVDAKDGRIMDAFVMKEKVYGELRLAAGFGGPRV